MSVPPWKPETDQERRDFTGWVLRELDRQDEAALKEGFAPDAVSFVKEKLLIIRMAQRLRMPVSFPGPKRKRGRPHRDSSDLTDFNRAERDLPRIRAIFQNHWGKRNRYAQPLAEEIAAERWELSEEETLKLIQKTQRRS
jgi:hypothetical protein